MSWDGLLSQFRQQLVAPGELCALLLVSIVTITSIMNYVFGKRKKIILAASYFDQHSVWNPEQMLWISRIKTTSLKSFFWTFEGSNLCQASHHSSPWQPCLSVIIAHLDTSLFCFDFSSLSLLRTTLPTFCNAPWEISCPCPQSLSFS